MLSRWLPVSPPNLGWVAGFTCDLWQVLLLSVPVSALYNLLTPKLLSMRLLQGPLRCPMNDFLLRGCMSVLCPNICLEEESLKVPLDLPFPLRFQGPVSMVSQARFTSSAEPPWMIQEDVISSLTQRPWVLSRVRISLLPA